MLFCGSLFSIAYGRPLMLSSTSVPLPQIIDGEHLPEAAGKSQHPHSITRYHGFIQSCILFNHLRAIINGIYQSDEIPNNLRASDLLSKAMDINHRLDEFAESLPTQLQLSQKGTQVASLPGFIRLQQQVLSRRWVYTPPDMTLQIIDVNRFLYLKLCVFRPFILLSTSSKEGAAADATLQTTDQSSVEIELIRQFCYSCLQVAYQLSKNVYDHLNDRYCSTGWHHTHCTSACGRSGST